MSNEMWKGKEEEKILYENETRQMPANYIFCVHFCNLARTSVLDSTHDASNEPKKIIHTSRANEREKVTQREEQKE